MLYIFGCSVLTDNSSPNIEVIEIVKHEFESIYDSLITSGKVIVLNKDKDIWAYRTIIDSAQSDCDKELFSKVYEFARLSKKPDKKNLKVLYDNE